MPARRSLLPSSDRAAAFALAGVAVLALSALHQLTGFGGATFAAWYLTFVFGSCGLIVLARVPGAGAEWPAWALLGSGLVIYSAGTVVFNFAFADDTTAPFPSVADGLWLTLYPLAAAGIVVLVRRRLGAVTAALWLDGVIIGGVVAAAAAAVVFDPVLETTVANGAASVARLLYPLGDLLALGLVVAVSSFGGRRPDARWSLLAAGFALLGASDTLYVIQAAAGTWAPGAPLDIPYAAATMLLAAAAWQPSRPLRVDRDRPARRFALPLACAVMTLGLVGLQIAGHLNPVAAVLAFVTLLALVVRFGDTLRRLDQQRTQLAELASTDPLTGVANQRTLHARLEEEVRRARRTGTPLSVVALDVDHFKSINDTYGHAEGDAILRTICDVLRGELRPYDTVARMGGEEFALVMPGADGAAAEAVAERCRLALLELDVHDIAISCSAGVAAFPADDEDGTRLLELADGALYFAKQSGRAQVRRYDPHAMVLLSSAEQHRQVRAVLDRPDAITTVFQPLVELATGRIAGFEALSRFAGVGPVRPPDQWFAQARRCGLGPALEARAIERALAVPARPAGTFLTLNVSPAGLLSREVRAVLPRRLEGLVIELTEDELFAADEALDHAIADLRVRGALIAVDDAGAGYAGLQQLIRVRPDILKLDRSLIRGVHADGARTALLEALSRFAITTGAAVCAEGIEDIDELSAVARLDVTYGQGYALARPGAPWPALDLGAVAVAAAPAYGGVRVAGRGRGLAGGRPTLGDVSDAIARVRSPADLNDAVQLIAASAGADEVAVSRAIEEARCVETLSDSDWSPLGERFAYSDFPSTERVVVAQIVGQIVCGDSAADPAEVALLLDGGHAALLMAPIVHRGATVGLLELYRRAARPWTATEIDQVRVLAYHLGPAIAVVADDAAPV